MKRHAVAATAGVITLLATAVVPCQAQFMKQLGQELLGGGQNQNGLPGIGGLGGNNLGGMGGNSLVGNVNLPQGQYMMTNLQTNQAFYVTVQNGQMFFSGDPNVQNGMPGLNGGGLPAQQGGLGGMVKNGLGGFLQNQLNKQQQPQQ